jgi:hypothetical protein
MFGPFDMEPSTDCVMISIITMHLYLRTCGDLPADFDPVQVVYFSFGKVVGSNRARGHSQPSKWRQPPWTTCCIRRCCSMKHAAQRPRVLSFSLEDRASIKTVPQHSFQHHRCCPSHGSIARNSGTSTSDIHRDMRTQSTPSMPPALLQPHS